MDRKNYPSLHPFYFLLLLFIIQGLSAYGEKVINLDTVTPAYQLGPFLQIYKDPTNAITIKEIHDADLNLPFYRDPMPVLNLGYTTHTVWIRFTTTNTYDEQQIIFLEIDEPTLEEIVLYAPTASGYEVKKTGRKYPYKNREIQNRKFVFPLPIEPGSYQTFYLSVKTENIFRLPLYLETENAFYDHILHEQILLGLLFGIVVALIIYNILIFIGTQEQTFLLLAITQLLYLLVDLSITGIDAALLPAVIPLVWPYVGDIAMSLLIITTGKFFQQFVETEKTNLPLHQTFNVLYILQVVYIIGIFLLPESLSFILMYFMLFLLFTILIMSTIVCKNNRYAKIFLFAFTFEFLGILVYIIRQHTSLAPTFFTDFGRQLLISFAFLVQAFGVSYRLTVLKEEKEAELISSLDDQIALTRGYARFVPKELLSLLNKKSITQLQLGDTVHKRMTVLFTSLGDNESRSKYKSAEEHFQKTSDLFQCLGPVVRENNGFVDKFLSDGIMALFTGTPDDALKAALEMLEIDKDIYIGINTGELMFGTVGEHNRMDGTVISDAVNQASRLKDLAGHYKVPLLISGRTFLSLENRNMFDIRFIDKVTVKGKEKLTDVYEVFNSDPGELQKGKKEYLDLFNRAFRLYYDNNVDEALNTFTDYTGYVPEDHIAEYYIRRCKGEVKPNER